MRSSVHTWDAREYQRVSFDASGRERSPEEQHGDACRAADRYSWTLGPAYRDVGSASRYARKVREDYARLVTDIEAGRFGASILILWESSRGSRRLSEWVRLIELCEEHGIKIYVTSDGKLYDPSNPRDRRSLQEDATDAEYESSKVSKRVTRAARANAAEGKPHGPVPYGYRRTFDPNTGRPNGQEIEPSEAAVVREIYERINAGHSLRAIARDLEARGIRKRPTPKQVRDWANENGVACPPVGLIPPKVMDAYREAGGTGDPWPARHLSTMVLRPLYVGQRKYDPSHPGPIPSPEAVITEAIWPPIVSRSLWLSVQAKLTDPSRLTRRPGRGVHLLSMIARCDVCDGPMAFRRVRVGKVKNNPGGKTWLYDRYVCHSKACVAVDYHDLNAHVEDTILAYLRAPGNIERLVVEPVDPAAVEQAEAEVREIEQELADLADQLGAGSAAARKLLARALPQIEARLEAARAHRDELTRPAALAGLFGGAAKSVTKWWRDAPMSTRREVVRFLLSPEWLGELRITKAAKPGPGGSVEDRVVWRTRQDCPA